MAAKRSQARALHPVAPQVALDITSLAAALAALDASHPALAIILADVAASGSHTIAWGKLRSKLFPGPTGWSLLQRWCAEHSIVCGVNYGSSSRTAEVQFTRLRPTGAP